MKKQTHILLIIAVVIIAAVQVIPAFLSGNPLSVLNKVLLVLSIFLISVLITLWADKGK